MPKISKVISRTPVFILICLIIASGITSVVALRHNNQTMVKLRNAVYAADKNNTDVNLALNNLRDYVYGHMNTSLSSGTNNIKPPIQLKYTYQRLYDSEVSQIETTNQQVFSDAQNYCISVKQANFDSPCVQNYVVNHGVKDTSVNIPVGLYQFDFISPSWSPDLAGWSLVATAIFLLALVVKLFAAILARR